MFPPSRWLVLCSCTSSSKSWSPLWSVGPVSGRVKHHSCSLSLSRVNLLTSSTLVARRRRRSQSVSVLSFPAPAPPASTLVTFPGHSLVSVSCPFFLRDARATTTTATLSHRRRHQLAALNATSSLDHFSPPTSAAAAASSSASPPLRVKRKRRRRIPRSKR